KSIYDKIKAQFHCVAFVSVGQNPNLKKVFKDIFYDLDNKIFSNIHNTEKDERILMNELREFLADKRYLIIIDDIWEEETWKCINWAFSRNSLSSRIITTTRKVGVAQACLSSVDDIIHEMKPLSAGDSQILFYRRIFQCENSCPDELQKVSKDILKKCGGVPLAIITIASLLVSNQQVKQKDEWFHLLSSIGRGLTEGATVDNMNNILLLSYYDLPCHLKTCFLYLSIFPEDFEIEKEWLIWRWIAEGFIQRGKKGSTMFEVGETYFSELVNRSLIMPQQLNSEEEVISCRIHDMVLDLIYSLSSEENFVTVLDNTRQYMPNLHSKVRRLSLQNSTVKLDDHQFDVSKVRSFAIFPPATGYWLASLSSLQYLRILELGDVRVYSFGCRVDSSHGFSVEHITNLFHLRQLVINDSDVKELPHDIGKLRFLQSLDISRSGIKEIPASFVQLQHLIRLCLGEGTVLPKGFGNLTSLEVLKGREVSFSSIGTVKELPNLTELRVLHLSSNLTDFRMPHLSCDEMDKSTALMESLGSLRKLQSVQIDGRSGLVKLMGARWVPPPRLRSFLSRDKFLTLPKWINLTSLPHLSSLYISVINLHKDDINIIGMLPALRYLFLHALTEDKFPLSVVRAGAFPSAIECAFRGIITWPCLFAPGSMPWLKRLSMGMTYHVNYQSGEVDVSMAHLPCLERVAVYSWGGSNARAALMHAWEAHPNLPTVEFWRCKEYCVDGYYAVPHINMLLHELMPNGSLNGILHGKKEEEKQALLDWPARVLRDQEGDSYGVVLLELLTGKRPTDESFLENGTRLVTWL
ncbi:disease resistance protein RGA5-like, partial [Lolium rigidum]|uniref:disease resistance protein RGA5-like n=1 Tax=Lolium rigidum TaxID=89674 RepID=UPI001F5CD896